MSDTQKPMPRDDSLIDAAARQFESMRAARPVGQRGSAAGSGGLDARSSSAAFHLRAQSLAGYDLIAERHRGGQGVVYEALQRATKRKVAIKFLYDSQSSSTSSQRRFELEIEILSQLRHPNIVTVHDSGQSDGRFYYVMDLVAGVPLDRWIEARRRERAEQAVKSGSRGPMRDEIEEITRLFIKICDAVNAAHLRGVIHRDLKPGNILIDGAGDPHVLDFGLAKYTYGMPDDPSGVAAMTQTGQFVGSLPWSSPEQVTTTTFEMDMRSDVYALGVLSYYALTGLFPYRVVGSPADVVDQIRNAEPRRMNDARRHSAESRSPGVTAEIDGELETIVLKCLQKDRERRYQTAGDLGRDLQRYLQHEPIEAKRDSFGYLLSKQLRRHRLAVSAAVAVLVALTAGMVASLMFWHQADQQRIAAEFEGERARKAELDAIAKREEADTVVKLLEQIFGSSDEYDFPGPNATIKQVVESYAATVFKGLEAQPEVELRMHLTLGNAYYNLAEFEKAEEQYTLAANQARRLLGDHAPRVSEALNNLGTVHLASGAPDKAEADFRAALAVDEQNRSDPNCLEADTLLGLGAALSDQDRIEDAEKILRRAIELPETTATEHRGTRCQILGKLGKLLAHSNRAAEAEPLLRQALEIAEQRFGRGDPRTATARSDLANLYFGTGRAREAVPLYEAAAAAASEFFGERDPRRAIELSNLGIVLKSLGELDRAESVQREALSIRREKLPTGSPPIAFSLEAIGTVLEARREYAEAESLYDESAEIWEKRGTVDADLIRNRLNRARIRYLRENYDAAGDVYEQVLATQLESLPPTNAEVLGTKLRLGTTRLRQQRFEQAEILLRECLNARRASESAPTWQTFNLMSTLGEALSGLGKLDEAGSMLKESAEGLFAASAAPIERRREAVTRMVAFCEKTGDTAGASMWREKQGTLSR